MDNKVFNIISKEAERQDSTIELIASENHVSPAVMKAVGSCMTNKYAEGYPGKRYYSGCENHDAIESLAIERAKELFNCNYANVQPHSGASANIAVFLAFLPILFIWIIHDIHSEALIGLSRDCVSTFLQNPFLIFFLLIVAPNIKEK